MLVLEDIRGHLLMVHRHIAWPVVLRAVDLTLPDGVVDVAVADLYRCCTDVSHDIRHEGGLQYADRQSLQIIDAIQRLRRVEVPDTGIIEGEGTQTGACKGILHFCSDIPVQHLPHAVPAVV